MQIQGIYETVLYASDLAGAAAFYQRVLGLRMLRQHEIVLAFDIRPGVLLIFDPEKTRQPDRSAPSHGALGPGHLAFSILPEELAGWRQHLAEHGVEVESEVARGQAQSIYFRDPAGNSLELVTGRIWGD